MMITETDAAKLSRRNAQMIAADDAQYRAELKAMQAEYERRASEREDALDLLRMTGEASERSFGEIFADASLKADLTDEAEERRRILRDERGGYLEWTEPDYSSDGRRFLHDIEWRRTHPEEVKQRTKRRTNEILRESVARELDVSAPVPRRRR
jgi:hypothetical protein